MRIHFVYLILMSTAFTIVAGAAETPEWVQRLPFSEDAFWGVGDGSTPEEAEDSAKREILMQMSSRVEAVISMEVNNSGGAAEASESVEAFFADNSLRGAELVDLYQEDGRHWALMKYCDDCGRGLIKSALNRYSDDFGYDREKAAEYLESSDIARGFQVERRLEELRLEGYGAEDILVRFSGKQVVIMIINFIPYEEDLSDAQTAGLNALSATLLDELTALGYRSIEVVGHANPTGSADEEEELIALSRNRAETLADRLSSAGLNIDSVTWMGGVETIGDVTTEAGRGLNRRVEIVVNFE